jgi:hypothetical protein
MGAAVLLFLPWLALAWPALRSWPAVSPPLAPGQLGWGSGAAFGLGSHVEVDVGRGLLALALMLAGIAAGLRRPAWRESTMAVAGWALAPLVLMGLVSLARPAWNPKFLIAAAPAWELLWGLLAVGSIAWAGASIGRGGSIRWAGWAAAALLAVVAALALRERAGSLAAMYFDPAAQRDDYRGLAVAIDERAGPDDAVVLDAPTQVEVYGYYDRGRHATYPLPASRPPDRAATELALRDLSERHRDVFGVLWATGESDPEGIVEAWLNARRYKASDRWFGGVRLVEWAAARPMRPVDLGAGGLDFGEEIVLERLEAPAGPVRAGDVVTLEAAWRPLTAPRADYAVFTQLLGPGGRLLAQRDLAPVGGSERTSTWEPSTEAILDRMALRVPADALPGEYRLILGLYDPASGARLPVAAGPGAAGDHVEVGSLRVAD